MTTPTLTHDQADFLRVIVSGRIVKICNQGHVEGEDQPEDHFIESFDGLIECVWDCVDYGESPDLTDAGREALAAHDATHVTVSAKAMVLARETLALMIDDHGRKMIDQPERLADIEPLRIALAEINAALATWEAAE